MMTYNGEHISVIIPTLNGSKRLPLLFESLLSQDIGASAFELIVVDDDSTDETRDVAARYGARLVRNGHRNIERGKAIGMAAATNDLVFFIDDDNRLPHTAWLRNAVEAFSENPEIVGVQAARFAYDRSDPAANRYCSLFGINDPMAYYLHRRDRLTYDEDTWKLPGSVLRETPTYWLVEFNPQNLLTVGSQGFLTRKSLIEKTNWQPFLFHLDSNLDLVRLGHSRYVMLRDEIIHDHCSSVGQMLAKLHRNMKLFLEQGHLRRYKYETPKSTLVEITMRMLTVVDPALRALAIFRKTKDPAAFLHVVFSVRVPLMYIRQMVFHKLRLFDAARQVNSV
jgi:glycosyltransferase involved in cell wall biosynthesis